MTGKIIEHEMLQVERANATGRPPVVFIHGLWLLPSSWDRWANVFEDAGYTSLTPGWPDDPETVEEAHANPEVFAKKTVGEVADHYEQIVRGLNRKPAIIGHSFGGLIAQILAGVKAPAPVDVNALAAALIPHLPAGTDPQVVATDVIAALKVQFDKP